MKFIICFLSLLFFFSFNINLQAEPTAAPFVVTIDNDAGGLVLDYEDKVELYNKNKTFVVIKGDCFSACTLLMKVENICAEEDGYFLLHGAYSALDKQKHIFRPEVTRDMSNRYYPKKIQALVAKYDVAHMGVATGASPPDQSIQPGISIIHEHYDDGTYWTYLAIKADKIVPKCAH